MLVVSTKPSFTRPSISSHTVKEWLRVSDMVRTAEVIVEMLRLHANGAAPGS